jgi:hypothetical protein
MTWAAYVMSEDLSYAAVGQSGHRTEQSAQEWAAAFLATHPRHVPAPAGETVAFVTRGEPDGCCMRGYMPSCPAHLSGMSELIDGRWQR